MGRVQRSRLLNLPQHFASLRFHRPGGISREPIDRQAFLLRGTQKFFLRAWVFGEGDVQFADLIPARQIPKPLRIFPCRGLPAKQALRPAIHFPMTPVDQ